MKVLMTVLLLVIGGALGEIPQSVKEEMMSEQPEYREALSVSPLLSVVVMHFPKAKPSSGSSRKSTWSDQTVGDLLTKTLSILAGKWTARSLHSTNERTGHESEQAFLDQTPYQE